MLAANRRERLWTWGAPLVVGLVALSAPGCGEESSGDSADGGDGATTVTGEVTWHQDLAPLVAEKCQGCHSEGGIAPFSLETYDEAKMWARSMVTATASGLMPPWGAQETDECVPPGTFKDDLRLSDEEKDLFRAWFDQETPLGDPDSAAPLPERPELTLTNATREITIPSAVEVEGTQDDFVCFRMPLGLEEDVWLDASQVVAGNDAIVHHALVYLDRNDESAGLADESGQYTCFGGPRTSSPELIGVWAPGSVPMVLPEGSAMPVPAGSSLVVQVHYHPTGAGVERDDSTRVQVRYSDVEPEYLGAAFLIGNSGRVDDVFFGGDGYGLTTGPEFLIPAGAENHVETNRFHLQDAIVRLPLRLWMLSTHMHYVGTDMKLSRSYEGEDECLLQTPEWDFNWQRGYFFDGPIDDLPAMYPGDDLTMRCTYNNSMSNRFVREALEAQGLDEPVDVRLGDETLDEMCLGIFGIVVPMEFADALGR